MRICNFDGECVLRHPLTPALFKDQLESETQEVRNAEEVAVPGNSTGTMVKSEASNALRVRLVQRSYKQFF